MDKEKEYVEHIREGWKFAKNTAKGIVPSEDEQLQEHVTVAILDKLISPYHYFIQDNNEEGSPTAKQIGYAKKLGIENPESYTKKTLSEAIDKAKRGA